MRKRVFTSVVMVCLLAAVAVAQEGVTTIQLPKFQGYEAVPAQPVVASQIRRIFVPGGYNAPDLSYPGFVAVIDSAGDTLISVLPLDRESPGGAYNPVTNKLYVATILGGTKVIDGSTLAIVNVIRPGSRAVSVAVDPSANRVYIAEQLSGKILVLDGTTDQEIATIDCSAHAMFLGPLTASPLRKRLYAGLSNDPTDQFPLIVIDTVLNQVQTTLGAGLRLHATAIDSVNDRLVAPSLNFAPTTYFYDLVSHVLIAAVPHQGAGTFNGGVAYDPGSNRLFLGRLSRNEGSVDVYDAAGPSFIRNISVSERLIYFVAADSATGKIYASERDDFVGAPMPGRIHVIGEPCERTIVVSVREDVLAHMAGVAPTVSKLEDAVKKLETYLQEVGKAPADTLAALGALEGAVGDLEAARKDSLVPSDMARRWIDSLVGAAERSALKAIGAAEGDPRADRGKIATSRNKLLEGQQLRTRGDAKAAVSKFKDAVSEAQSSSGARAARC